MAVPICQATGHNQWHKGAKVSDLHFPWEWCPLLQYFSSSLTNSKSHNFILYPTMHLCVSSHNAPPGTCLMHIVPSQVIHHLDFFHACFTLTWLMTVLASVCSLFPWLTHILHLYFLQDLDSCTSPSCGTYYQQYLLASQSPLMTMWHVISQSHICTSSRSRYRPVTLTSDLIHVYNLIRPFLEMTLKQTISIFIMIMART